MPWWIIFSAITAVPLWILLPRYRLPAPLALVAFVPYSLGVIVVLYLMAFRDDIKIPGIDK
ncbi:MAG: hypothetical protein AAFQ66_11670 [Pseudomonadota bacterium]